MLKISVPSLTHSKFLSQSDSAIRFSCRIELEPGDEVIDSDYIPCGFIQTHDTSCRNQFHEMDRKVLI